MILPADRIEARLRELSVEDDFAGSLNELESYPKLTTRSLSTFERDLRDWGFVFGLAFGLAISNDPELAHPDAAAAAFRPAHMTYERWSGPIEDPGVKREAAIRSLLRRYKDVERERDTVYLAGREPNGSERAAELRDAVHELAEWARG